MEGATSTRRLERTAWAVVGLSALLVAFFGVSKHSFAEVNPFAEDPFDAVGSFGVQLAPFAALLSLLRILRPYPTRAIPAAQAPFILRGLQVSVLAVAATLAADGIALVRTPEIWIHLAAGRALGLLTLALAIVTGWVGWALVRLASATHPRRWNRREVPAAALVIVGSGLALAFYPAHWRLGFLGAIGTAVAGMLMLMLPVAASLWPWADDVRGEYDDTLDDLDALAGGVAGWLQKRTPWLVPGFTWFDRALASRPMRRLAKGLDPRVHPWRPAWVAASLLGVMLAVAEGLGEGVSPRLSRTLMVGLVFTGIEAAGVLSGYAVFRRLLGICRDEKEPLHPMTSDGS